MRSALPPGNAPANAAERTAPKRLPRRTTRDALRWIGWDVPLRLVPLAALALLWATFWADGPVTLKLTWHLTVRDVLLMLGGSLVVFTVCLWYRVRYWPLDSLPSPGAHLVEDAYFLFWNAPAEELFFRGMLQSWALASPLPPVFSFLAVAVVFGASHRLAGFPLSFVLLATGGGVCFGLLFLFSHSLLTPIVVHFVADVALFNAGPALLAALGSPPQHNVPYRI